MNAPTSSVPYHVGHRYLGVRDDQILTVRYIGHLGTPESAPDAPREEAAPGAIWIGVEWDDPARGKHSGDHDGRRYFSVKIPGSGSFLRYRMASRAKGKVVEPELFAGRALWPAIREKYLARGINDELTPVPLSLGRYREIEIPNLDKVARKLESELQEGRLRVLDLAGSLLNGIGDHERPQNVDLASVQTLDISRNLCENWEAVAVLVDEMPSLGRLIINHSRLPPPLNPFPQGSGVLSRLRDVHIRNSALCWPDVVSLAALLPGLEILDISSNPLIGQSFGSACEDDWALRHGMLQEIDMSSCGIGREFAWGRMMDALSSCERLQALYLSANPLRTIPVYHPGTTLTPSSAIQTLVLFPTEIRSWSSIDDLSLWCPNLTELKLYPVTPPARSSCSGEGDTQWPRNDDDAAGSAPWNTIDGDFSGDMTGGRADRAWMIAKLRKLRLLNGTEISTQERIDSERAYVRKIAGMDVQSEVKSGFARFDELKVEHDMDAMTVARPMRKMDLKSRMIRFRITSRNLQVQTAQLSISLLPSSPLKLIPTKLSRLLGTCAVGRPSATDVNSSIKIDPSMIEWSVGESAEEAEAELELRGVVGVGGNGAGAGESGSLEDLIRWAVTVAVGGGRSEGETGQDEREGRGGWWIAVRLRSTDFL